VNLCCNTNAYHKHYYNFFSACNTDTTPTQPHRNFNTHRTKNNTTNVVIQQNSRKLLMMDILISKKCWAHKKWNEIASDFKLVFCSSLILQQPLLTLFAINAAKFHTVNCYILFKYKIYLISWNSVTVKITVCSIRIRSFMNIIQFKTSWQI